MIRNPVSIFSFSLILLMVFLSVASCIKKDKYSLTPAIEFVDLVASKSKADLSFKFTDGDGDIGLGQADTNAPMAPNCFLKLLEKQNGIWTEIELPNPFTFRIPFVNTSSKKKPIAGLINIAIEPFYSDPTSHFDTIKYEVYIIDRSLNKSNIITTKEVKVVR